jgi:hypothetical protein
MTHHRLHRPLSIVVGFLAIVGVGAAASHYFLPVTNPGFLLFPLITALHVVLGGTYLALAPFQFVKQIRSRWPDYHRWAGRLLVAIGLIVGTTALFMAWVIPFAGWPERVLWGAVSRRTRQRIPPYPRTPDDAAPRMDDSRLCPRSCHRDHATDLHSCTDRGKRTRGSNPSAN